MHPKVRQPPQRPLRLRWKGETDYSWAAARSVEEALRSLQDPDNFSITPLPQGGCCGLQNRHHGWNGLEALFKIALWVT